MPKVTMSYITLSCYSDKVSGNMMFAIEGIQGNIQIPMKPEEAERVYAIAIEIGQKAYSDYVGYAVDIPIHVPACLPDLRATDNADETHETPPYVIDDEIPF